MYLRYGRPSSAYHDGAEGLNNKIKLLTRMAYGLPNFARHLIRILMRLPRKRRHRLKHTLYQKLVWMID
jgi:hypothetical protein